jgi:DUF4097 and DUF4098 domain-containing protein YvlB
MQNRRLKVLTLVTMAVLLSAVTVVAQRSNRTETFDVKKGGQLVVETENASADIFIRVWDKNQVVVKAEGIPDDDRDDLEMRESGGTVYVEYYGRRGWRNSRHARFMINVPREFDLDLSTAGGDIEVDDMIKGGVKAATSGGDIDVDDVDGVLELATSGGDIRVGTVKGDAELRTSGGDIEIDDVEGVLDAKTSGGDITIGNVAKSLDAKTAGGDIEVGNVGGDADCATAGGDIILAEVSGTADLRTAGGDIEIESASGKVSAQTAGGDMKLLNITGSIKAETAGGDVEVHLDPQGSTQSTIETKGGDIVLRVPASAKTEIEAEIRIHHGGWGDWDGDRDYDIYSDFDHESKDRDKRGVHAKYVLNGGGARIYLETMHGDITIEKSR